MVIKDALLDQTEEFFPSQILNEAFIEMELKDLVVLLTISLLKPSLLRQIDNAWKSIPECQHQ